MVCITKPSWADITEEEKFLDSVDNYVWADEQDLALHQEELSAEYDVMDYLEEALPGQYKPCQSGISNRTLVFSIEDDIETVPDTDDVDEEMLVDIGSPSGVLVDISVLSIMLSAKEGGFVSGFSSEMLSVGFSSS